ncbi:MAG: M15 family metallopeptidase [Pseudomonadota bacterium]|nr:M15 family metallopeptidase [Pseudomonadota bacterium]
MNRYEQYGLINIKDIIPRILLDIRYATSDNFYMRPVYSCAVAYLREPVAKALARSQHTLDKQGLSLKIFDAYRPFSVQELFFSYIPDPVFLKKPIRLNGLMLDGSNHSRGSAVDLTIVDANGRELEAPTPFDEFSDRAKGGYQGGSAQSRKNRDYLKAVMMDEGFLPLESEWWHFDGPDYGSYDLLDIPL